MNRKASRRVSYEIVIEEPLKDDTHICEIPECGNKALWDVGISEEGQYGIVPSRFKVCEHCKQENLWDYFFADLEAQKLDYEEMKAQQKYGKAF